MSMIELGAFVVSFVLTSLVWVVVLVVYNAFIGTFEFGPLGLFALKSAGLIAVVVAVGLFVPGGRWLTLLVWALGILILFRPEARDLGFLVLLIWVANILVGLVLLSLFARPITRELETPRLDLPAQPLCLHSPTFRIPA